MPSLPSVEELVKNLTPAQLHPKIVSASEEGAFTILDLFDSLPWFKTGADWTAWRAFLCALFGLPMTPKELAIYRECTGRTDAPTRAATEAWVAVGRRGRKSAVSALIGIWYAAYRMDYAKLIAPGETARVIILSKSKDDAKQIHSYASAILNHPSTAYLLDGKSQIESIPLKVQTLTGSYKVEIVIRAATIMAGRTRTVLAGLLDEVAFFRSDESANPDRDIIAGIKPAMSTIPGALLLGVSSPYARRGVLWEAYEEHFGKDSPVLFWKAPTLTMHRTPQVEEFVETQTEEDPVAASAEYGAEFRTDVEAYVSIEAVKAVTAWNRFQNPPVPGAHYVCFVDPSGGTGDPMTAAVGHWDGKKAIVDFIWEVQPPFQPSEQVAILAQAVAPYGIRQVEGDHWGGEWPGTIFKENGLLYYACDNTKSTLYQNALPWINSGGVELLDNKRLRQQLVGLDRRAARGGRDSIDHLPGSHDDVCLVAGTMVATTQGNVPIENVVIGQEVLIPGGTAKVTWAGQTGPANTIGRGRLQGTAGHPVFHEGIGFVPLAEADESEWSYLSLSTQIRWAVLRSCTFLESSSDSWGASAITSASQLRMRAGRTRKVFTSQFGRLIAVREYLLAMRLITRTIILSTTVLRTWSAYRRRSIGASLRTLTARLTGRVCATLMTTWAGGLGIALQQAWSGTGSMRRTLDSALVAGTGSALSAGWPIPLAMREGSFAQANAESEVEPQGSPGPVPVYNLGVDGAECFYANDVLVHNCNAVAGVIGRIVTGRRPMKVVEPEPTTTDEIFMRMIQKSINPKRKKPMNPYAKNY